MSLLSVFVRVYRRLLPAFSVLSVSSVANSLGLDDDLAGQCAGFADGAFFLKTVGFGCFVEREDAVDAGLEFAGGEPAVDVGGGGVLLLASGVEHGETKQAAILGVKRAYGKDRAGVAAINSATGMYANQLYAPEPDFVWLMIDKGG